MTFHEILTAVTQIMRELLDDDSIHLTPETTSNDVEGWDSVFHITLIVTIQQRFKIKFQTAELEELKSVGQLVHLIEQKTR